MKFHQKHISRVFRKCTFILIRIFGAQCSVDIYHCSDDGVPGTQGYLSSSPETPELPWSWSGRRFSLYKCFRRGMRPTPWSSKLSQSPGNKINRCTVQVIFRLFPLRTRPIMCISILSSTLKNDTTISSFVENNYCPVIHISHVKRRNKEHWKSFTTRHSFNELINLGQKRFHYNRADSFREMRFHTYFKYPLYKKEQMVSKI